VVLALKNSSPEKFYAVKARVCGRGDPAQSGDSHSSDFEPRLPGV
jgi:hypothetical protein